MGVAKVPQRCVAYADGMKRVLTVAAIAGALLVGLSACSDSSDKADTTKTTMEGTGKTTASGPPETVKDKPDDVFNLSNADEVFGFRGGSVTAAQLSKVKDSPAVKTPMTVAFSKSLEKVLKERSRNQLRTIIAAAKDDRGKVPRVDPFHIERTGAGDLAVFVLIDNASDKAISGLSVQAQVLVDAAKVVGAAKFDVPASEIKDVPAGSAAVTLLTIGKDRLDDPKMSLNGIGLRLDLTYKSAK